MVSHSGLITVMTRAARKAAPRVRRDFGEVEQLQVSRKGRPTSSASPTSAPSRPWSRNCATRGPTGPPSRGGRHDRGQSGQAALGRRPDRRHVELHPRHPHFAISIAVQEPKPGGGWGEISHGLVYQPLTDESFWAEKGRGAWRRTGGCASRRAATCTRR